MRLLLFCLILILTGPITEAAMASGNSDLQQVYQATLDSSALDRYFHVDALPERKPLLILKNDQVLGEPKLTKFGESIKYVSRAEIELNRLPHLEFLRFSINGDSAHVEFAYPPEGIAGVVTLAKDGSGWHVTSHSIVER